MEKLWFEQSLRQAVNKSPLHTQMVPNQDVSYENGTYAISPKIRRGLQKLGHVVTGDKRFAIVQAVFREPIRKYSPSQIPGNMARPRDNKALVPKTPVTMINDGKWRPSRSVIIQVINKIGRPRSHTDDRCPITASCPITLSYCNFSN